ncbi:MAG: alpha-L-arabinofuranosidase C-terminal domain-containing protein, partial [Planctomycetota bacterium]|nr:alpha-L-arabinofuranosidase C-terminal domain-containing protein [Planctomycetota bacterium]
KTLGSAIYTASTLRAFLHAPRVETAHYFKLLDPAFMGLIGTVDNEFRPNASYYALALYTRHFGDTLIESSADSPTYNSTALGMVAAVQNVPWLEVAASRNTTDNSLRLIIINRHFDSPMETTINLADFSPASSATLHTLTGPSIDANTGTELLQVPGLDWARQATAKNGRFTRGAPSEITLTESTINIPAAEFTHTFPPRSITALIINRAD